MAVEVVGDLAHDAVVGPDAGTEDVVGHAAELGPHVIEIVGRRFGPVLTPDHHGDVADLAVGDPTDVVFVVPSGETGRFAEFADRSGGGHLATCCRG